jgi:hypothetical protein
MHGSQHRLVVNRRFDRKLCADRVYRLAQKSLPVGAGQPTGIATKAIALEDSAPYRLTGASVRDPACGKQGDYAKPLSPVWA